jgi:NDP-sugar pyrophosphorylase family protein
MCDMAVSLLPADRYGYDFIDSSFIPKGKDEYWIRNTQSPSRNWRNLSETELEILIQNRNVSSNWNDVLVCDPFNPALIRDSNFYGLVRIGKIRNMLLKYHDFCIPTGIRNSVIVSCDIGDDAGIQDCSYVSHYVIGDRVILSRIDEMQCTDHAKFGNGVVKDGEDEDVRVWIDVMNEAGGRSILPFEDLLPADAFLWAAYRDDEELCRRFIEITQKQYCGCRAVYGTVGSDTVIKSCKIIKDTKIGSSAYIKGANKLKNITILSSEDEKTQIGEGVELVNGIVGYGCSIFYGAKAVRFVLGRNSNLKYGARLIHSVLGDNSTVSCCEILNNLVFPVHEQHHNNSFLIASLIGGMSNMAAGATIGSNHNSRANDGEIRAGRGFWPGLMVSLKHNSRFASFMLVAQGNYSYELNIDLPFSLVNNNAKENRLEVMPAYFWMYNMYALERNSWKSKNRDKRKIKIQHIESDYLSPDAIEEIIHSLEKLKVWMEEAEISFPKESAFFMNGKSPSNLDDPEYSLNAARNEIILAQGLERSKRKTVILKPNRAVASYREMLFYYCFKTFADFLLEHPSFTFQEMLHVIQNDDEIFQQAKNEQGRISEWENIGGQIIPSFRINILRDNIKKGVIDNWHDVHAFYDEAAKQYSLDKLKHAYAVLKILDYQNITQDDFKQELKKLIQMQKWMNIQVYKTRARDFSDPFRSITYRNEKEMEAVVGKAKNNSFIQYFTNKSEEYIKNIEELIGKM